MTALSGNPHASIVWWSELERWVNPNNTLRFTRLPGGWKIARMGDVVLQLSEREKVQADAQYRMIGVKWYGKGTFHRETVKGDATSASHLYRVVQGALIYNRLFAWKVSFAVVPQEHDGFFVSGEFPQFQVDNKKLLPEYLYLFCITEKFVRAVNAASIGSAAVSRNRFKEEEFLSFPIPLPPLPIQRAIVRRWEKAQEEAAAVKDRLARLEAEIPLAIYKALGTPTPKTDEPLPKMMLVWWKNLERWSFNYLARARRGLLGFAKSKYPVRPLGDSLLDTMNGFCIKPVAGPTPHKMLKLNALSPAGLDLAQTKFVKVSDKTAGHFSLSRGDLLICRSVGSYDLVAKCAVVQENRPDVLFPDIIIRARFNNAMLPEFAREIIQTPLGRSYFQSNARTAVGMWKIGAEDIKNFPIPIPPLDVQRSIVGMVAKRRTEIAGARQAAAKKSAEIAQEVEEMILGTRKV